MHTLIRNSLSCSILRNGRFGNRIAALVQPILTKAHGKDGGSKDSAGKARTVVGIPCGGRDVVCEGMVCGACLPAPQSPMWSYNSLIHQPDNSGNTGDVQGAPLIFRYIITLPPYDQTIPFILPYISHKYHIISIFISNKFPCAVYTFPFIHMYPIFFLILIVHVFPVNVLCLPISYTFPTHFP